MNLREGRERLAGKIAIVTGAAGGIGAATAELFCAAGARVVMADRNAELLAQSAAGIRERIKAAELETIECDVADYDSASNVVNRAREAFGGLSILVSNAAIRHWGPIENTGLEDWNSLIATNLMGAVNFCRASAPELRKSGNASVVIVSSCYAVIGRKEMPIYDATKAALLSLMRTFAFDVAENNVRVNAVCPGGTITPHTIELGKRFGMTEDDMRAERKGNSLLGRRAEADEIAYPILFLASDEASYITGATLMVDAGLSIM
jgi:2-hydroxycyclohexanecarboxyl-CoA dehydrogenase